MYTLLTLYCSKCLNKKKKKHIFQLIDTIAQKVKTVITTYYSKIM